MARSVGTFVRWVRGAPPALPDDVLPSGPVAYLDIETTGLSATTAQITLVGIAWRYRGGRRLEQFFVEHPRSEPQVLRAVAARLRGFAGTVTYNGSSFDLPFLRRRARAHGLRWPWIETFDLLGVARAWRRRHGRLRDCRLKTVMSHFRIGRTDETTGLDMIDAYERWLQTGDDSERNVILEHNAQDVLLLPDIVPHLMRTSRSLRRNARSR